MVLASTRDEERVATITAPLGDRVAGTFTAVREHVPLPTAEAARAAAKDVAPTRCWRSAAARRSGQRRPSR